MKIALLSLFTLFLSVEAFAQIRRSTTVIRGPRYNPPGSYRPGPVVVSRRTGPVVVSRPGPVIVNRPGPVVIPSPRYIPRRTSTRIIRSSRRPPIVWSSFTYSCSPYGELYYNGQFVHQFRYSSDCSVALSDIRLYGDFCDAEDLYDQSGVLEAQYNFNSECRSALGYYY